MVKYGETFHGQHTALNTGSSEVILSYKRLPLETKNTLNIDNGPQSAKMYLMGCAFIKRFRPDC